MAPTVRRLQRGNVTTDVPFHIKRNYRPQQQQKKLNKNHEGGRPARPRQGPRRRSRVEERSCRRAAGSLQRGGNEQAKHGAGGKKARGGPPELPKGKLAVRARRARCCKEGQDGFPKPGAPNWAGSGGPTSRLKPPSRTSDVCPYNRSLSLALSSHHPLSFSLAFAYFTVSSSSHVVRGTRDCWRTVGLPSFTGIASANPGRISPANGRRRTSKRRVVTEPRDDTAREEETDIQRGPQQKKG